MANAEHLKMFNAGHWVWNEWAYPKLRPVPPPVGRTYRYDLSGLEVPERKLLWAYQFEYIDFQGANLEGLRLPSVITACSFRSANLRNAILESSNLRSIDFTGADLSGARLAGSRSESSVFANANLQGADLTAAKFRSADFNDADLRTSVLQYAELQGANVERTNFEGAQFGGTLFIHTHLGMAIGLEHARHVSRSTIDLDAVLWSRFVRIPDSFFRGIGIPEELLQFLKCAPTSRYPSCFISYSNRDQDVAERLHTNLQNSGVRCWFASEDLKIGDRFQEEIERHIKMEDKLLVVLSESSVRSRWVERDVNAAREREDLDESGRDRVLVPIRIDDAVMDATAPWATDLRRSRHIGDFTRWKDHDSYQKAFERLLRDLRADAVPPPTPLKTEQPPDSGGGGYV